MEASKTQGSGLPRWLALLALDDLGCIQPFAQRSRTLVSDPFQRSSSTLSNNGMSTAQRARSRNSRALSHSARSVCDRPAGLFTLTPHARGILRNAFEVAVLHQHRTG